jgi:3-methyl-2-oxobutanoate hydroxymethyltransferase
MSTRPRQPGARYASSSNAKLPLPELEEMKRRGQKIVMVTAYDAPGARLADEAGIDLILVGDSAAMVVLGHSSTVPVTMDEMVFMTRTVARAAKRPVVVGDMPFGTYQVSDEEAVRNAVRFVKEGSADAVKIEGAGPSVERARAIVGAGIPVRLYSEARALEAAGCFALVLEAVPAPVAATITEALTIPTIGIGAGAACDGQVLVYHDLLGLYDGPAPRFVKRYANLADEIRGALGRYADEVRTGAFPEEQHTYAMPDEELALFEAAATPREG